MKKKIALILGIILTATTLASCTGAAKVSRPSMSEGATAITVTGNCKIEKVDEKTVRVSAECDLVDGTLVRLSVDSQLGKMLDSKVLVKGSEALIAEFEIQEDWPEIVMGNLVSAASSMGKQPSNVTDVYGKKFENLSGDNVVYSATECSLVLQSETLKIF